MPKTVQRQIVAEITVVIEDSTLTDQQIIDKLTIKGPNKAIHVTGYGIADPEPA